MSPFFFTFGDEDLTIEAFMARLQVAQVKAVVDVCELPLSRKKGFQQPVGKVTTQLSPCLR